MPEKTYQKKVLILLAQGFELIETSCFTDVFAWASFQPAVEITTCTAAIHSKVSSAFGGFSITPDLAVEGLDLNSFDALAIPGGMEWAGFFEDALSDDFAHIISHFVDTQKPIAAVCVASISVANSSARKGLNAAIYHSASGKHKARLEQLGATFCDQPIVKDGQITTSTGPGTAVQVALSLLEDLTDPPVVKTTKSMMRIPEPTQGWYLPQV